MSPNLIVLTLALLLGLQAVASDLYLPALPQLTDSFGATVSQAQLTLTAMLLAFGLSQLVWGPVSDRLGRRPILLTGLVLFVLAGVGTVLAPSMAALIGWRAVQGIGMGACTVCARAIVRDLYAPTEGAKTMSKALSGLGVIAFLSMPLGALLTDLLGWRAALAAPPLFACVCLCVVALRFDETLAQPNPKALQFASLWQTWWGIIRNPTFVAFAALSVATYCGLFTYLAASSFVYIKVLGLSRTQYALALMALSLAYIPGTFLCRWMLRRYSVRRTVAIGAGISLAGGSLMGILALAGWHNLWALMLPYSLFMLGHGIHQACGQSGSVGPFPQAAGAASALNGVLMMLAAFAMGHWLGGHLDGTVYPLAFGVWFWSVMVAVFGWTLVQRYGHHDPH